MNWIRVDVGIASDPKLHQFAKVLKVRRSEAIGLFVTALCKFPDHARDGNVERIEPETLSEWAGWPGKPDVFAAAFRSVFCDACGFVNGWEKHNGAPLRKAKADADRKRESRGRRGDVPPDGAEMSSVRDETNETGRDAFAVAVHCDSKKQLHQLPSGRTTRVPSTGPKAIGTVISESGKHWAELMRKADGRIA